MNDKIFTFACVTVSVIIMPQIGCLELCYFFVHTGGDDQDFLFSVQHFFTGIQVKNI